MLLRSNSFLLKLICFVASPTQYLPALIPLQIERARVGQDIDSFVTVKFR
jgi:hypothetical protein